MSSSIDVVAGAARRFLIAAMICAAAASRAAGAVLEDTVATVNGRPILLSEYQKEMDGATENFKRIAPTLLSQKSGVDQLRKKVLDQMIDNELIGQEAEKKKLRIHDREVDNGVAEIKERNFRRDESGKALSDEETEAALAQELKKDGLAETQFRDRIRKQLMIRKVIDEEVRPRVTAPEDAALHAAYDKIALIVRGDTTAPVAGMPDDEAQAYLALGSRIKDLTAERIRIAHILVKFPPEATLVEKTKALERARDLKKRIDAGEDFGELAKKQSEDAQSVAAGGDMGFVVRGWLPAELERVAFATVVGEVSGPVETPFGFHLVRVLEKKAAEKLTFDKAKDDVAQFLYNLRFQSALDKYVKLLRDKAQIEVHLPKMPDTAAPKDKTASDKKPASDKQ